MSFLFVFFLAFSCISVSAQEESSPKNVLVLYGWTDRNSFKQLEPFKSSLRAHLSVSVNFNVEYLESVRFEDPAYRKSVSESLYQAYKSTNLDLVVVGGYPALRFALDYRDRMFPRIPIFFVDVATTRLQGQKIWPGVTGTTTSVDIRGTLDLALHLSPDTQNVVLLSGTSEFERYWEVLFREELRRHANLKLTEFAGLPDKSVLNQVSAMPAHTIVFVQIAWQDATEPALTVDDILAKVSRLFPTYSIFVDGMDHGFVGGSFADENAGGKRGGEIAARVLSGEKPEQIPVEPAAGVITVVDWRQLHHWNISEGLLPPGAIVLNPPPSMWELYKWRMIGVGLLLVMQTVLIIALFLHRRRRKRAEQSLARQLRFETLISDISSEFINLPLSATELGIQKSLVRLRNFLDVDRISILELADKETHLRLRHAATVEGVVASREAMSRKDFPWLFAQIRRTEPLVITGLDDLPIDAKGERELFLKTNPDMVVIFPLNVEQSLVGVLSFVRVMSDTAPAFIWTSDREGKLMLNGKISIDSKPNAVTRIHAYVPLTAKPAVFSVRAD